jgi:hypothetical protein
MVRKHLMLAFVVFGGIALVATMGSLVADLQLRRAAAVRSTSAPPAGRVRYCSGSCTACRLAPP